MQTQKRMKRKVCSTKDVFGREDWCLWNFLYNDLDFFRKVKARTICEEKGFTDKEKRKEKEWEKFRTTSEKLIKI